VALAKEQLFAELRSAMRECTLLQTVADTLEWDERTGMPPGGGEYRAEQVTLLRGMVHAKRTDARIGDWLEELAQSELAQDSHSDIGATVQRMREDYARESRLPQRLVEALAGATMRGQQAWEAARHADRFDQFLPILTEIIALKREAAACLAVDGQTLYDALLQEYEPGASCQQLQPMFVELRNELVQLIREIQAAPRQPDISLLQRRFAIDGQQRLSRFAAERIGFDFRRGRLDETTHPFCTSLGPSDCRILTRYDEHWFPGGLFGTLHEAGHGMYDQGLRGDWYGLPPGSFVSLGIHESQSRMWENLVGRSRAFWEFFYPHAQHEFPQSLSGVSLDDWHFALNVVRPSLIRVEADEATYNLHIIVRFELEQALIQGELQPRELPAAWDERYREVLGIRPPNQREGVLQDVHWSAGLIGYFPTYTLGNLYAAQLFAAAERDLGDLAAEFRRGDFASLLSWLREKVHQVGRCWTAAEIVERACGQPPQSRDLVDGLRARYAQLYGF
jgi:carboxypeptidase Taq